MAEPRHSLQIRSATPTTGTVSSPRYDFRLERVRALRERAEREATERLAASMIEHARGLEHLDTAEQRLAGAHDGRRDADTASGADLLAGQAWLERIERVRQAAVLDLGRREADVDARRDALVQAARDHRALQRLADRGRVAHERHVARIETARLDEVALAVHRRGTAR